MRNCYLTASQALGLGLLLMAGTAQAQAPVVTGFAPAPNTRTAAANSPVTATFSQPIAGAAPSTLHVFSAQRGGRRTTAAPALASGNTLTYTPTAYPFMPGETVQATATTAAQAGGGGGQGRARVVQFTTAVGGTGRGGFVAAPDVATGNAPSSVVTADVDGDGDLDLLTSNYSSLSVSLRLNNGSGVFSGVQEILVPDRPRYVVVGDVDGDGDLDLLIGYNDGINTTVSVRLNNGSGGFAAAQNLAIAHVPTNAVLGDMDGDGDLDLVCDLDVFPSAAGVYLNNGSGVFGPGQTVALAGSGPVTVAIGDVNNDGQLDLLGVTAAAPGTVSIRLNNNGTFGGTQTVAVGTRPSSLTLGDVDNDGDLDLLTTDAGDNAVSVRLNDGAGNYSGTQSLAVGTNPFDGALGDVDGDGDLDLLVANADNSIRQVSLRLNNGSGIFGGGAEVSVGIFSNSLALADLDGDNDLDFVASNAQSASISVRLNQRGLATATGRAAAPWGLAPNPAREAVAVTGALAGAEVAVFDALGRPVAHATANAAGTARLALPAGLAPGVYVVKCGTQAQRLAVE